MGRGLRVLSRFVAATALAFAATSRADAQDNRLAKLGQTIAEASHEREMKKATDAYDDDFKKYTKRYFGVGFDWHIFKAQGMAESNLKATARSRVGARGIMQLMPATYGMIQSKRPEFKAIDDPASNIAAGIMHDRYLWTLYAKEKDVTEAERTRFMLGAYNAGEGTIARARRVADSSKLDRRAWTSLEQIAPKVQRWRYPETLGYVRKIEGYHLILEKSHR